MAITVHGNKVLQGGKVLPNEQGHRSHQEATAAARERAKSSPRSAVGFSDTPMSRKTFGVADKDKED